MRLTLRYLLAYLDDQLEPADTKEMSERIEASSFATELMHRVHDVSRRLKLGAPKLFARGLAADANTVAEYLDHTMPAEQVTEFEKICLTSDVHLAEVASAHQILALVLGERAEVDPKLRRRMYAIPEQEQALAQQAEREAAEHKDDHDEHEGGIDEDLHDEELQTSGPRQRRRPEIPEWLREKPKERRSWIPLTLATLLLIVGGAGAFYFLGMPGLGGAGVKLAAVDADADVPPRAQVTSPAEDESPAPIAPAPAAEVAQPVDEPPLEPPPAESVAEQQAEAAAESATEAPNPPVEQPADDSAFAAPERGDAMPAPRARPTLRADEGAFDTDVPPNDGPRTALNDQALVPEAERPAEPTADGAVPVGRLVNDSEVLLHGGAAGAWQRLSTRDALVSDDELIALPTFRPGVALSTGGGAIAHLLGGSVVRLTAPDANDVPGLHIIDGQVVVATAGKPGTQLNIQVDDQVYLITFLGPDARIAVDVRRWLPDGADPLDEPARTTAELYVPNGEIEYTTAGSQAVTLRAPAVRTWLAKEGAASGDSANEVVFPPWINGNPLSQFEKRAADDVSKELIADDPSGEPLLQHLRELSQNRRVEVRNLAVQCLTLLGDFEGLLPLLNDEKQRTNWPGQIEAARRAMVRSPQIAKQLQETLESQRDAKKAKDLYEMLRGFSKRQLQDGAAARLVSDLDHEDLDYRILAFWNLQRVAVGTLTYKPEYNAAKRQSGVRAWKQRLADGQIVPK